MIIKAKITNGNIKLGNMGSFSKLYGDDSYIVTINGHDYHIKGSCGKHCVGCKGACYVPKSYRYPSVVKRHAVNSIAFRDDLETAFADLAAQLARKRKPFEIVRINQSGELESELEFLQWCGIAGCNRDTNFYVYTKAYECVEAAILADIVPQNLTVLVSIWHDQGIEFYRKVKDSNRVKAFVYMDGYDYSKKDLHIETMCEAYRKNAKGKMTLNKKLTCSVCRKCIDGKAKVIGCLDH